MGTQEPNSTFLRPSLAAGPGLLSRTETAPKCAKAKLPRVIHTEPSLLPLLQPFPARQAPRGNGAPGNGDRPRASHRAELQRATNRDPGLVPVQRRGSRSPWVPQGRLQKGSPCAHSVLFPQPENTSGSHRDKGRESQNYLGEKGPLNLVQSNPCREQGHIQLGQVAQSAIQAGVKHFLGWAFPTSVGSLTQCFTTLFV